MPDLQKPIDEPKPPNKDHKQPAPGIEGEMSQRPRYLAERYRPAGKLQGQVALITGGDSGIGRAVALIYAREGADVALVYLPQEEPDALETAQAVEKVGRRALRLPGDVTNPVFCKDAVERTVAELGKLNILVNNAAFQQNLESIDELTLEQFDKTFKTNIYAYFYLVKAALPHLQPGAAIINTGSQTGLQGNKELIDYSATKGAVHTFTKSLAQALVSRHIRVNCVVPGPIWTPLQVVAKPPEEIKSHGQKTPMGRAGQPEEVAPVYVFLASEADSSYITGELIPVMGGTPYGA